MASAAVDRLAWGEDTEPCRPRENQRSADFHILLALADEERHGYGIILEIADRTAGVLRLGTGTLYTALARLEALACLAYAAALRLTPA